MTSRREEFEKQIQELHADIANLSSKLSMPPSILRQKDERAPSFQSQYLDSSRLSRLNTSVGSIASGSGSILGEGVVPSAVEAEELQKLRRENASLARERDHALQRLEIANKEIDELRMSLLEMGKLRAQYDHLKQDHENLKLFLESSERIRKNQKGLIDMLQRSHAVTAASDNMSVGSFDAMSSIDTPRESGMSNQTLTTSIAAENRSWLNAFPAPDPPYSTHSAGIADLRAAAQSLQAHIPRTVGTKRMTKSASASASSSAGAVSGGGAMSMSNGNNGKKKSATSKVDGGTASKKGGRRNSSNVDNSGLSHNQRLGLGSTGGSATGRIRPHSAGSVNVSANSPQHQPLTSRSTGKRYSLSNNNNNNNNNNNSSSKTGNKVVAGTFASPYPTSTSSTTRYTSSASPARDHAHTHSHAHTHGNKKYASQFALAETIYSAPVLGKPPRYPSKTQSSPYLTSRPSTF